MYLGFKLHTQRIYQQTALSATEFLSSVVSAYPSDAGGLHGLGVEDCGARLGIATSAYANPFAQHRIDLLPGAVQAP